MSNNKAGRIKLEFGDLLNFAIKPCFREELLFQRAFGESMYFRIFSKIDIDLQRRIVGLV